MRYLIDTNILIPYFAGDKAAITLLRQLAPEGFAVSILAYLEAYQGVIESPDPAEARRKFDAFFSGVPIVPVSPAVARRCAEIRSLLKGQGKSSRKRAFDLVIAATALEHGLALVTDNTQDYRGIPNLLRYRI